MNTVNKLLDLVKETCSLPTDAALAEKLDVSRQLVSQWRKGANPLSDDRIAQLARLAKQDAGKWMLTIHVDQAHGDAAKIWSDLAKRLGAAAALVLAVALPLQPANASAARISAVSDAHHLYIMSHVRRRLRAIAAAVDRWRSPVPGTKQKPRFSGAFSWRHAACLP